MMIKLIFFKDGKAGSKDKITRWRIKNFQELLKTLIRIFKSNGVQDPAR